MPRFLSAAVLLFVLSTSPALAAGDPAAGQVKAYTCTGCHGIPGYKNTYPTYNVPKLGGQNAEYVVAALKAYQSGARKHSTMNLHAEGLSDQDMEDIAAWLASIEATGSPGTASGNAAAGAQKSAACQACHGENGVGTATMYPNLAGQYASYLEVSLAAYRDGGRNNPLMMPMAANLTDQDIADLAAFYASQGGLVVLPELD